MSWLKKVKSVYKEPTLEELMDDIFADPFVQLEIQMTTLGFRKRQPIEYEDHRYKFTDVIHSIPYEDKNKFWNISKNLLGKYVNNKTPIILRHECFYVSLYRFRNKNHVYGLSKKLGLIDLKEIMNMKSNEIAKVLGDLDDMDNLRQFMRNNSIDKLFV